MKTTKIDAKELSSPDSIVSMVVGLAVVIILGMLAFNYMSNRKKSTEQENQQKQEEQSETKLPIKHIVTAGETLWSIAEKYIHSGYNYVDIQKANNLPSADRIEVGQELTIPDVIPIVPQNGETSSTAVEIKHEEKTYTVVRGDYLWKIAIAQYGNGYKWLDIAKANKLDNPDLIHAGNVLVLP